MKKTRILNICECSVLLSLSVVLSFIVIYRMPMGGGVTLLSMLPVMIAALKHGTGYGVVTAFMFSMVQLIQGIVGGGVFSMSMNWHTVVICILFDYIVPFTALGFAGLARSKNGVLDRVRINVVFASIMIIRFACHYITGVVIWGQWAPDGMGSYLYSLIYNVQYMVPELILTLIASNLILSVKGIERYLKPAP